MLNCQRATELISAGQERTLTLKEKVSLRIHTSMCSGCRNFESSVKIMRQAMLDFSQGRDNDENGK